MLVKLCTKCKQIKEAKDFYRSKITKNGLSAYCRPCSNLNAAISKRKRYVYTPVRHVGAYHLVRCRKTAKLYRCEKALNSDKFATIIELPQGHLLPRRYWRLPLI